MNKTLELVLKRREVEVRERIKLIMDVLDTDRIFYLDTVPNDLVTKAAVELLVMDKMVITRDNHIVRDTRSYEKNWLLRRGSLC